MYEIIMLPFHLIANGSAPTWDILYSPYYPFYGFDLYIIGLIGSVILLWIINIFTDESMIQEAFYLNFGFLGGAALSLLIVNPFVWWATNLVSPVLYFSTFALTTLISIYLVFQFIINEEEKVK